MMMLRLLHFRMTTGWLLFLAAASTAAFSPSAHAWSNHALGTWQALASADEVANAAPVRVEGLDAFLAAEGPALERLLDAEESWARSNVPHYPARPAALAFKADGSAPEMRRRFIAALRINPASRLTLFMQVRPGTAVPASAAMPRSEVTTVGQRDDHNKAAFLRLHEGDLVTPLDVTATASDEPDFGLDIGIWADNGTGYGRQYGFGKQPFGNPALEFSSQAPMHMGFFHEQWIVYKAAPFLLRTYPEYRIHLYQTLARHALRSGHPYWGWRFAGWALHYVQDLTQPYHARVVPGVGTATLLWTNSLALLGMTTQKEHAITLVSNRHQALENYQVRRMRDAYARKDDKDALLLAARDATDDKRYPRYTDAAVRASITQQSHAAADATDAALERGIPPKYISDPDYVMTASGSDVDLYALVSAGPQAARDEMTTLVAGLMKNFGIHSRLFIRALAEGAQAGAN
ncbi:hypothetical protein [Noviherbaspirillum sp.]|jgi:hypothetical protein|uniref:hypothetical protein n=1 Tax=Noviherbaspirillum sp. TaxID=1926288 RepID=UPI0025CC9820|nr:hypothetical protein [Noviherbaspirillum sp.]